MKPVMIGITAALAASAPTLLRAAPVTTILHSFTDIPSFGMTGPHDGFFPQAGLAGDPATALYGTTDFGGTSCGSNGPGCGSAFQLRPPLPGKTAWREKIIARFNDTASGGYPASALTLGTGGVLYGATGGGGTGGSGAGNGIIFQLTPPAAGATAWSRLRLYEFAGGTDGAHPLSRLLLDSTGALYGTTSDGGAAGDGTVFRLTPPAAGKKAWTKSTLYSFSGTDGAKPLAGLILTASGALAGTTSQGGSAGFGVIYTLTPPANGATPWTETILFSFTDLSLGASPASDLLQDTAGNLYGTNSTGGANGHGTVFELLAPAPGKTIWRQKVLHNFRGGNDGANPLAGVSADAAGALYGTTLAGGAAGFGTVYKLSPPTTGTTWTETQLHSFAGGMDGTMPVSTLVVGTDGGVYGTTRQGGAGCPALTADGCGTVFEVTQ